MRCQWAVLPSAIRCTRCGRELPRESLQSLPSVECGRPGLGDAIKAGLSSVGITEELVSTVIGRPCGCSKRVERLNEIGKKFGM